VITGIVGVPSLAGEAPGSGVGSRSRVTTLAAPPADLPGVRTLVRQQPRRGADRSDSRVGGPCRVPPRAREWPGVLCQAASSMQVSRALAVTRPCSSVTSMVKVASVRPRRTGVATAVTTPWVAARR
jgi:hypothetical protein